MFCHVYYYYTYFCVDSIVMTVFCVRHFQFILRQDKNCIIPMGKVQVEFFQHYSVSLFLLLHPVLQTG